MAAIRVPAVFEKGVFRPLQPVEMAEQERVEITVENARTGDPMARLRDLVGPGAWPPPVEERLKRRPLLSEEMYGSFHIDDVEGMRRVAEDPEFGIYGVADSALYWFSVNRSLQA